MFDTLVCNRHFECPLRVQMHHRSAATIYFIVAGAVWGPHNEYYVRTNREEIV